MNISDRFFAGMRWHIAFSFSCGGTLSFQLPRPEQARFPESDQIRSDRPDAVLPAPVHNFPDLRYWISARCNRLLDAGWSAHKPVPSSADHSPCNTCTSTAWTASGKNPAPAPAYSRDRAGYSRQLHGLLERGARMGRHQIRHEVLLLPAALHSSSVYAFGKFADRPSCSGFPIHFKHRIRNMLRRYLELSADMILHTVPGKRSV